MINYNSFYESFRYNLTCYIVNFKTPQNSKNDQDANIDCLINQKLSDSNQKREFFLFIDKLSAIAHFIFKNGIDTIDLNNLNKVFYQDIYTDDQILEILNSKVDSIKKNMLKNFNHQLNNYTMPATAAILIKKIFKLAVHYHSPEIIDYFKNNLQVFNDLNDDEVELD